eukprot:CFRG1541T1
MLGISKRWYNHQPSLQWIPRQLKPSTHVRSAPTCTLILSNAKSVSSAHVRSFCSHIKKISDGESIGLGTEIVLPTSQTASVADTCTRLLKQLPVQKNTRILTAKPATIAAVLNECATLNEKMVTRAVLQRIKSFSPNGYVQPSHIQLLVDIPVAARTSLADNFRAHVRLFDICVEANWSSEAFEVLRLIRAKNMVPTIQMINTLLKMTMQSARREGFNRSMRLGKNDPVIQMTFQNLPNQSFVVVKHVVEWNYVRNHAANIEPSRANHIKRVDMCATFLHAYVAAEQYADVVGLLNDAPILGLTTSEKFGTQVADLLLDSRAALVHTNLYDFAATNPTAVTLLAKTLDSRHYATDFDVVLLLLQTTAKHQTKLCPRTWGDIMTYLLKREKTGGLLVLMKVYDTLCTNNINLFTTAHRAPSAFRTLMVHYGHSGELSKAAQLYEFLVRSGIDEYPSSSLLNLCLRLNALDEAEHIVNVSDLDRMDPSEISSYMTLLMRKEIPVDDKRAMQLLAQCMHRFTQRDLAHMLSLLYEHCDGECFLRVLREIDEGSTVVDVVRGKNEHVSAVLAEFVDQFCMASMSSPDFTVTLLYNNVMSISELIGMEFPHLICPTFQARLLYWLGMCGKDAHLKLMFEETEKSMGIDMNIANSMLSLFADRGDSLGAFGVMRKMSEHNLTPNVASYDSLALSYINGKQAFACARELLNSKSKAIFGSERTPTALLEAYYNMMRDGSGLPYLKMNHGRLLRSLTNSAILTEKSAASLINSFSFLPLPAILKVHEMMSAVGLTRNSNYLNNFIVSCSRRLNLQAGKTMRNRLTFDVIVEAHPSYASQLPNFAKHVLGNTHTTTHLIENKYTGRIVTAHLWQMGEWDDQDSTSRELYECVGVNGDAIESLHVGMSESDTMSTSDTMGEDQLKETSKTGGKYKRVRQRQKHRTSALSRVNAYVQERGNQSTESNVKLLSDGARTAASDAHIICIQYFMDPKRAEFHASSHLKWADMGKDVLSQAMNVILSGVRDRDAKGHPMDTHMRPTLFTCEALMSNCVRFRRHNRGILLWEEMNRRVDWGHHCTTPLVDSGYMVCLARAGRFDEALDMYIHISNSVNEHSSTIDETHAFDIRSHETLQLMKDNGTPRYRELAVEILSQYYGVPSQQTGSHADEALHVHDHVYGEEFESTNVPSNIQTRGDDTYVHTHAHQQHNSMCEEVIGQKVDVENIETAIGVQCGSELIVP